MGGKVVHISDDLHTRGKIYAASIGMTLTQWVESMMSDTINQQIINQSIPNAMIVQKKPPVQDLSSEVDEEIYTRPPFWANRHGL